MRIVGSNALGDALLAMARASACALAAACVAALAGAAPVLASEDDVARWLAESEAAIAVGSTPDPSGAAEGPPRAQRAEPSGLQASSTLSEQLARAEAVYRARRWASALDAYQAIVATEPVHALAWLRIGNLHQRRRQWLQAASAYRKAARDDGVLAGTVDTSAAALDEIRTKALVNLAIVNLELAEAALAQIDRLPAHLVGARDAAASAVQRVRDAVAPPEAVSSDRVSPHPAAPQSAPAHAAPRQAGARSRAPRREDARATVPLVPAEAAAGRGPRPEVEYLRGAPKP